MTIAYPEAAGSLKFLSAAQRRSAARAARNGVSKGSQKYPSAKRKKGKESPSRNARMKSGSHRPKSSRRNIEMEPLTEALQLMQRQATLEDAMRSRGGVRVLEERELYALRARLTRFPDAVRAILETSNRLHRPVDSLSIADIEPN